MTPPSAASFLIRSSSMLRGWLNTALAPECDRMIGVVDSASIWSNAQVGRMRRIDHDAEPVRFGDELLAERRQPVPFRTLRIGRGIGKIVVGEMHRPDHAHAEIAERLEQREVLPDRIGVLHALIDDALAAPPTMRAASSARGRELEIAGVARHHLADFHRALQRRVARRRVALRRARPLAGVDGEEPAIEPAPHHARIIHLGEVVGVGVVRPSCSSRDARSSSACRDGNRASEAADGWRSRRRQAAAGAPARTRDRHQACKACYRCVHGRSSETVA